MKNRIFLYLFRRRKALFIAFLVFLLSIIFISWGPLGLYHRTSSPEFCGSCHVMEYEQEAWFRSMHRNIKCIDCHLPNDNVFSYAVWKGLNGAKDIIYFYGRLYDEHITISSIGKSTIKKNCLKCHEGMISMINTNSRTCWSCHRRVNHNFPMMGYL